MEYVVLTTYDDGLFTITKLNNDEPVMGVAPVWQPLAAQVLSLGAPVEATGGMLLLVYTCCMHNIVLINIAAVKSKDLFTMR
jgi:hypothetical protein